MDASTHHLPPPPPPQTQALPSITHLTSLTNPLPETKENNLPFASLPIRASDPRDSGNWSQSKRACALENNIYLANKNVRLVGHLQ